MDKPEPIESSGACCFLDPWWSAGAPACMHAAPEVACCLEMQLLLFVFVIGLVGGIGYIDFGAGIKRSLAHKAAKSMHGTFRTGYGSARDASDAPTHQHPQRARRARVLGSIAARCAAERREQREQAALHLAQAHHRRLASFRLGPGWRRWWSLLLFIHLFLKPPSPFAVPMPAALPATPWAVPTTAAAVTMPELHSSILLQGHVAQVASARQGLVDIMCVHGVSLATMETQSPAQLGPIGIELHENATLAQVLARTKRSSSPCLALALSPIGGMPCVLRV